VIEVSKNGKPVMKIFVWHVIEKLTDNFHPEGGAVVIASTIERACELLKERGVVLQGEEPDMYELAGEVDEDVYLMPNAGCC
jgi:hypothetical protein